MSNGDGADDEADAGDTEDEAADAALATDDFESRVDEAAAALEDAETEAALDDVESTLDEIAADLPAEPDEDEEEDEDEAIADVRSRLADLREDLEAARGPYAEDVTAELETAASGIESGEWTDDGSADLVPAVEDFLDTAGSQLLETFEADSEDPAALAAAVENVREVIAETDLDPDDDAETIETLLEAAESLAEAVEAAEEWDDLTVKEQLDAQGFYDVLNPENRKDYPPEWNAIKLYEKQYKAGDEAAVEMILLGLEYFESDFMEENVFDSLRRIAPPEAFDPLHELAQKRTRDPIEILGKIGDERALETIHEFVEGGDVPLRKTTLRAIGAIGSEESTQVVADQLVDDNPDVRSVAARALGLIGDTRAIDPLADVLDEDDADEVRASAAWALNQIGTERALDVAGDYADDASYLVQSEAEKAHVEPA
jgi:hypothetical protein